LRRSKSDAPEICWHHHPLLDFRRIVRRCWKGGCFFHETRWKRFYFNGIDLVKNKTAYVYDNGFGGVMIWNLGQDKHDSRSLLSAIVPFYT
jgi:hypothetical protein